ncbi:MAG: hypothetical protein U1F43_10040 [Myxococcota bacterium]
MRIIPLVLSVVASLLAGCDDYQVPATTAVHDAVDAAGGNDTAVAPDSSVAADSAVAPDTAVAQDTSVADTAVAQDSTVAPDTAVAQDTATAQDTYVEPDPDVEDPSAPGPLPDMGLPPLGYLNSPPLGATSTTCGTGAWWWGYTIGSENMQPGGKCIDCHDNGKGPHFSFAGTVMSDYDDADECRGIPGVTVDIIDADGQVALTMLTNAVGNFYSESTASIAMPYTARISLGSRVREMTEPTDRGDCNSCHTAVGESDAPGRIVLP